MEWFLTIVIILIVLKAMFGGGRQRVPARQSPLRPLNMKEVKRRQDIEDLKRKGYTDEAIAVIIPVIFDGQ